MPIEFAERIRRIPVYPVAAAYDVEGMALLASNETPFGPPAAAVEAAALAFQGANRYPDPSYAPLRTALSERYGVPTDRIALGDGSG